MNKTFYSVFFCGAITSGVVTFVAGLTLDGKVATIYLAMILAALMSVARILEERR